MKLLDVLDKNVNLNRYLSNVIREDLPESKDPFAELEGLSKRKSKSRSVFAWGLSATGAIGNTKYFNLQEDKHEQILKPYRIKYFNNMKVIYSLVDKS